MEEASSGVSPGGIRAFGQGADLDQGLILRPGLALGKKLAPKKFACRGSDNFMPPRHRPRTLNWFPAERTNLRLPVSDSGMLSWSSRPKHRTIRVRFIRYE